MHTNLRIARGAFFDLGIGLFLDCRNDYSEAVCASRIELKEREAPVTRNQAETIFDDRGARHSI